MAHIRPIAIYLPQFHPIPENDEWWGKGFTDWQNVAKSKPRFNGHYQPHLPSDLGFYDLRLPSVMEQQIELAKEYGIYGFMFYHYWFNGRRVLEKPVENYLKYSKMDFPFCLCWANENWTRNWDGQFKDILLKQEYSNEDDLIHIQYLCRKVFSDERYIKINGKPFFAVYRTELFPNIKKTADIWREAALMEGYPDLYLVRMESFTSDVDPVSIGFDAAIEFQPDWNNLPERLKPSFFDRAITKIFRSASSFDSNHVFLYKDLVNKALSRPIHGYKRFPELTPMWDNSPRRINDAFIFHGSTPDLFSFWLKEIVKRFKPYSKEENFIFINAWNEWAEGNHLEPCQKWGNRYLLEVRRNINDNCH
jgi:hypothetical protein